MPLRSTRSFADSLSSDHRRRFYEGHRSIAACYLTPYVRLKPGG